MELSLILESIIRGYLSRIQAALSSSRAQFKLILRLRTVHSPSEHSYCCLKRFPYFIYTETAAPDSTLLPES